MNDPAQRNAILKMLPRKELKKITPWLEPVQLALHTVLNESGKPITYGYFLNGGLASVLAVVNHSKMVEVGLTGSEGVVGLPLIAGVKTSNTRVIMQVAGSALRISAKNLKRALSACPTLERRLQRYALEVAAQSAQIAACNRLHDANQRLGRWLLMSQDRLGGNLVPLTQKFLAHMLGMRRASVNVALRHLQRADLIRYSRGGVSIEDRAALKAAACECYAAITRNTSTWMREAR